MGPVQRGFLFFINGFLKRTSFSGFFSASCYNKKQMRRNGDDRDGRKDGEKDSGTKECGAGET